MSCESIRPSEPIALQQPSTLHLFSFNKEQRETAEHVWNKTLQFDQETVHAGRSLARLRSVTRDRFGRINETITDLYTQQEIFASSETYSAVFLKLHDELSACQSPPTEEEFFDFFIKLARVALAAKPFFQDASQLELTSFSFRKQYGEFMRVLQKIAKEAPEWFQGDEKAWHVFVMDHSFFLNYLNREHLSATTGSKKRAGEIAAAEGWLGEVFPGGEPDWMKSNTMPNISEVVAERDEDHLERVRIRKELLQVDAQSEKLKEGYYKKLRKTKAWIHNRKNQVFPESRSFTDIVAYLTSMEGKYHLDASKKAIMDMTEEDLTTYTITPEKLYDTTLKALAGPQSYLLRSQEFVALWIEKQLMTDRVVGSTQDQFTAETAGIFARMAQSSSGSREAMDMPKKLFYEVYPFMTLLSGEEKRYLHDLIEDSQGSSTEYIIWAFAEIISKYLQDPESTKNFRPGEIAQRHLEEFALKWVKRNYKWAFEQMESSVQRVNQLARPPAPPVNQEEFSGPADGEVERDDETAEVMDTATYGNLGEWNVIYMPDIIADPSERVTIPKTDLQSREQWLEAYIRSHKIPHSGKISSVINALDWLVVVPQETEQLRMYMDLNGDRFKKLKRGAMRILYRLDPKNRVLTFSLHKKKDWNYGF